VVKDDDGVYHAKVTDFGYSTVSRGSSRINMPFSRGWTAPEYPRRGGYTFSEAMRMDVFSFGLVCLWLLFFSEKEEVPDDVQNALQIVLEDLVKTNKEITSDIVEILRSSLQRDPEVRCKDFVDICQLIGLPR
jgi:serine/threonine protein kinase